MVDFTCPECKDTGVYQGLNTVEPCRACGGKVTLVARNPLFSESLKRLTPELIRDIGFLGGQSLSHEIQEQITEEPAEITFNLDEESICTFHFLHDKGTVETNHGPMQVRPPETNISITLLAVPHKDYFSRYKAYSKLIEGRDEFKAIIRCHNTGTFRGICVLQSVAATEGKPFCCDFEIECIRNA